MPTPATYPNGTTETPTTTGMELRRGGAIVGRYHFRKNFAGQWAADCYTHDATGFRLDRVFHCPAGLRAARATARQWAKTLDTFDPAVHAATVSRARELVHRLA